MRTSAHRWTKPFHGVQHLGNLADTYRVSVEDWGSFAVLTLWTRGTGFTSTPQRHYDSAEEARKAGERWLQDRNAL